MRKIQIDFDHPVPEFARNRVEDFLNAWNPNCMALKDFVTSLYLQGLSDGFYGGEHFGFALTKDGREPWLSGD